MESRRIILSFTGAAVLAAEALDAGLNIMSKAATATGLSNFVFIVYFNILSLLILLPFTLFLHRKRPLEAKLTWSILLRLLLLAFCGTVVQMSMLEGVRLSSPTLASAMIDLTPAFTFIIAIFSGMEIVNLRIRSSQAKLIGTVISITGALIVTLYKGLTIISPSSSLLHLDQHHHHHHRYDYMTSNSNWVVGGSLLATSCFILSILYIVQAWIMRDYPAELTVTFISSSFALVMCVVVSLIKETSLEAWSLRPNIQLVAVIYAGIAAVVRNVVSIWAIRKKGPVYVAMFKPVQMVIAVVMSYAFLGDSIHVGSVVGAVVIAIGFYTVMWGKANEDDMFGPSTHDEVPLLLNQT